MGKGRIILAKEKFKLTLQRLSHQLIENHGDFANSCLIGIQPRGIFLSDRIHRILLSSIKAKKIHYGKLDTTFYRDDFRIREKPIVANNTVLDFLVEDKRVILVDDVLFSGRTIQAAMSALQDFGRPQSVELVTLVDRRFNRHLPIQADYIGMTVDALDEAYVKVEWSQEDQQNQVLLFAHKEDID